MFWTVLAIIAIAILIILTAVLIFVCKKMFDFALLRGQKMELGDGFKNQLAEYADVWEKGKELYDRIEKEDVWIESFDGLKLHGTLLKNGEGKKLLIETHGYRSNPQHDFIASLPYFYEKGCSLLFIDQRAHAQSEGKYITFGVHERHDLSDWVSFAIEKLGADTEIVLHGISMGASTVLMASGLDLPENVKGLIADSGFTSPYDIFVRVLDHTFHSKPFPILNVTELMSIKKAGFAFKDASTLDAMAQNKLPVMFVHGEDDDFVPVDMTLANYEACIAEKSIVRVKGALHACGYLVDRDSCEKELDAFLAKTLKI